MLPNKPDGETDVVVHMKEIGNKEYKNITKDTLIGTTGQNRRLEAIRITGHALHQRQSGSTHTERPLRQRFISRAKDGWITA